MRQLRLRAFMLAGALGLALALPAGSLMATGPEGAGSILAPSWAWADEVDVNLTDPLEDNQPESLGSASAAPEEQKEIDPDNLVNTQQLPDSSFIYDTLIADLATADSYLNNQTVQVVGEAVGDNITAEFNSAYCWIDLQSVDSSNSQVAVYMTKEQSAVIDTYGKYGARGTTLQVRGIFHLACPEHAGLSDLHANNVSIMKKGEAWESVFNTGYAGAGVALAALGVGLLLLFKHMQERRR